MASNMYNCVYASRTYKSAIWILFTAWLHECSPFDAWNCRCCCCFWSWKPMKSFSVNIELNQNKWIWICFSSLLLFNAFRFSIRRHWNAKLNNTHLSLALYLLVIILFCSICDSSSLQLQYCAVNFPMRNRHIIMLLWCHWFELARKSKFSLMRID